MKRGRKVRNKDRKKGEQKPVARSKEKFTNPTTENFQVPLRN